MFQQLITICLCLFLLNNNINNVNCQEALITNISLTIAYEYTDTKTIDIIKTIFKEIELENDNLIKFVENFHSHEYTHDANHFFCQTVTKNFTYVIDMLWTELFTNNFIDTKNFGALYWPTVKIFSPNQYHFLNLNEYLEKRLANDFLIIVNNHVLADQLIFSFVQYSQMKIIIIDEIDQKTINLIKNLRPQPTFYVIFGTTDDVNIIFSKVIEGNLIRDQNSWNLLFTDFNYDKFMYSENYTDIHKVVMSKENCCRFKYRPLTSNCDCFEENILNKLYYSSIFSHFVTIIKQKVNYQFYLPCNTKGDKFHDKFNELKLDIIHKMKNDELLNILSLYNDVVIKIKPNIMYDILTTSLLESDNIIENREIIKVAEINSEIVEMVNNEKLKNIKRFFRIGIVTQEPWTYMVKDKNNDTHWTGYCIDLIQKLSESMSFDYELVVPTRGTYGDRTKDGEWDGLVGALMTGDIDIAISTLKMTAEREEVIDFVAPFFEESGISIVIRKPVLETSLFKFMTVLRLEVWLSIVGALVSTAVLLWLLDKYSPYSAKNMKEAYPYPCREFTLKESFWFALTSFTPQGGGEAPKALSGRTLVAAYWLFVVLMLATFTANLAAFLTVERMQTPVQSLQQLARQSRINYTCALNSDTYQFFENMALAETKLFLMWKELTLNSTTDQTQYRVWEYPIKEFYSYILTAIIKSVPVKTADEGYQLVNEHEDADFAFIHDSAEIKYAITKNCNFTEVGEVFAEQPYAMAVQQGSHLQDELSEVILKFKRDRVLEKLTQKYWNYTEYNKCSNNENGEGITLQSLGGVFIATLFGLGLAMLTLFFEILYYRKKVNTRINVKPFNLSKKINKNKSFFRNLSKRRNSAPISPKQLYNQDNKESIIGNVTLGGQFISSKDKSNLNDISTIYYRNKNLQNKDFDKSYYYMN